MKKHWKRLLSLVLCLMLMASLIPAAALGTQAATGDPMFTKQPDGGNVELTDKLTVTWQTNFTPVKQEVVYTTRGSSRISVQQTLAATATKAEVAVVNNLDQFYIRAYYGSGTSDYILSSGFRVVSYAPFTADSVFQVGGTITVDIERLAESSDAWMTDYFDDAITYKWYVGGTQVAGATGVSYTPTEADAGKTIRCTIIGSSSKNTTTETISAKKTAVIEVGGVGMADGDYLASGAKSTTTTQPNTGFAYYKDGVLTLNNFVYKGSANGINVPDSMQSQIEFQGYSMQLQIEVQGYNVITCTRRGGSGIKCQKTAFTGTGTLGIYTDYEGIYGTTNYRNIINGCSLHIESQRFRAICGNVTVNGGGSLTCISHSTDDNSVLTGDLKVDDGNVLLESSCYGMTYGDLEVYGGQAEIHAEKGAFGTAGYIDYFYKMNVVGSTTYKGAYSAADEHEIKSYKSVKVTPKPYYTVTFDANGGSGTMEPGAAYEGRPYILPQCTFKAPVGKRFKCWRSGTSDAMPGDKLTVSGNCVVKAIWEDAVEITAVNVKLMLPPEAGAYSDCDYWVHSSTPPGAATSLDEGAFYECDTNSSNFSDWKKKDTSDFLAEGKYYMAVTVVGHNNGYTYGKNVTKTFDGVAHDPRFDSHFENTADKQTIVRIYGPLAPTPKIYVGGVGMFDGDYLAVGATATTKTKPTGGYAYYNNNVLVLQDYTYTGPGVFKFDDYYLILRNSYYQNANLQVVLKGTNKLTGTSDTYIGLYEVGSLSIFSENGGSLAIEQTKCGITAVGYKGNENISVDGCTISLMENNGGFLCTGDLGISNSTVTVVSNNGNALCSSGGIIISNSKVTATSAYDALSTDGDIIIHGNSYLDATCNSLETNVQAIRYDDNGEFTYEGLLIQAGMKYSDTLGAYDSSKHDYYHRIVVKPLEDVTQLDARIVTIPYDGQGTSDACTVNSTAPENAARPVGYASIYVCDTNSSNFADWTPTQGFAVYEAGKYYMVTIPVRVKDTYQFTDSTVKTMNGLAHDPRFDSHFENTATVQTVVHVWGPLEKAPEIYVGGVGMFSGDYLAVGATATTKTKPSGGYAYYNNGVLTLHNYSYTGNGYELESERVGISRVSFAEQLNLKLVLEGSNTISMLPSGEEYENCYSIFVSGDLVIQAAAGSSLTLGGPIYAFENISINGGRIVITGEDGICSYGGITIDSADVSVTTTKWEGIQASDNIVIKNSSVRTNAKGYALYTYKDISISGNSMVDAITTTGSHGSYWAVRYDWPDGTFDYGTMSIQAAKRPDEALGTYTSGQHCTYERILITSRELVKFSGMTMTLGNSLAANFVIDTAKLSGTDNYAVITKYYADGTAPASVTVPQSQWPVYSGKLRYIPFTGVNAKEMTDEFVVVVYNAAGVQVSETYKRTIEDYCYGLITKEENKAAPDPERLALYTDMLNYGAAAQDFFEYNLLRLANQRLSSAQMAYATQSVTTNDVRTKGTGYMGSTLSLKNEILMNFVYQNATINKASYAVYTFQHHDGGQVSVTVPASQFKAYGTAGKYIDVVGMKVADCNQVITVKLYDANGNVLSTSTDSVWSYASRNLSKHEVYDAVLKLADSAYKYFH